MRSGLVVCGSNVSSSLDVWWSCSLKDLRWTVESINVSKKEICRNIHPLLSFPSTHLVLSSTFPVLLHRALYLDSRLLFTAPPYFTRVLYTPQHTLPGPWACQTVIINEKNDSPHGPLLRQSTVCVCVCRCPQLCTWASVCAVNLPLFVRERTSRFGLGFFFTQCFFMFGVCSEAWSHPLQITGSENDFSQSAHTTWEQRLTRKPNYLLDKAFNLRAGHMRRGSLGLRVYLRLRLFILKMC